MHKSASAPWKKPKPKKAETRNMTAEQIQQARTRAAEAGRPYPNLVDNMAVLRAAKRPK